jgi:hypothetical protein
MLCGAMTTVTSLETTPYTATSLAGRNALSIQMSACVRRILASPAANARGRTHRRQRIRSILRVRFEELKYPAQHRHRVRAKVFETDAQIARPQRFFAEAHDGEIGVRPQDDGAHRFRRIGQPRAQCRHEDLAHPRELRLVRRERHVAAVADQMNELHAREMPVHMGEKVNEPRVLRAPGRRGVWNALPVFNQRGDQIEIHARLLFRR